MIRKLMLATAVMALASTPAWALPAKAPENQGTSHAPQSTPAGPPASTPNDGSNPGSKDRSEQGAEHAGGGQAGATHSTGSPDSSGSTHDEKGTADGEGGKGHADHGKGHSEDGKGKGAEQGKAHRCMAHGRAYVVAGTVKSVKLEAESEAAKHPTYKGELTLEVKRANDHAREAKGKTVEYAVSHVRLHGDVAVAGLAEGDWAKLIGKVSFMHKGCEAEGLTPEVTIRRIVAHAPRTTSTTTTTTSSSSTG